jgi:Asp/Glu/hydantoin racemase
MRIWYQSAINFAVHPNYEKALNAIARAVGSAGTEVLVRGREADFGLELLAPDVIRSAIVYHLVVTPIFVRAVLAAESAGADALVVGTYSEPILPELRSLSTIPIVTMPEATLLAGCMCAPKSGIVTLNSLCVPYMEKSIALHKMQDRISGIHVVAGEAGEHELDADFASPRRHIDAFIDACREAIAAGAQVLIPAEGVLSAMVVSAGLRDVDGVPVMDSVATSILFAELAVRLKQKTGLTHSPVAYAPPSPESRNVLKEW